MISFSDKLALSSIKQSTDPKVKVNKSDISLTFIFYKKGAGSVVLVYAISIFRYRDDKGALITDLTNKDVDMTSLRNAVMEHIYSGDRKYVNINLLTTKKVEFSLKEDWFEDAMKNLSPNKFFSVFKKDFRLKISPPFFIKTTCVNTKLWNDLIVEKLRKYFKESNIKKSFSFLGIINKAFSFTTYFDMFDWSYSSISNIVEGSMKAHWVVLILIGTSKFLRKR